MRIFRLITILRLLLLLTIPVLTAIKKNVVGESFGSFNITFPLYIYLLAGFYVAAQFLLSLYTLLFSFFTGLFYTTFLAVKKSAVIYYSVEALFFLVLGGITGISIKENFFTPHNGIVNGIADFLFQDSESRRVLDRLNKLDTINYLALLICSSYFLLCFWKQYKIRKAMTGTGPGL